jgi:hypothetical protein
MDSGSAEPTRHGLEQGVNLCAIPVPFHCDPKPSLATVVVSGNIDLFDVLLLVLIVLGIWALWRYIKGHR